MGKSDRQNDELFLALFLLKKRFHSPIDLIRYWSFAGPCLESHPSIEDISSVKD